MAALDEQEILREVVASRVDWWVRGLALKRLAQLEGSAGISGEFYNGLRPAKANAQAYDDKARERLHVLSMRLTSLAP